jgi:hypothetical protein
LTWNAVHVLARAGRVAEPPRVKVEGFLQTYWLAAAALIRLGRASEAGPLLAYVEERSDGLDPEDRAWLRRTLRGLDISPETLKTLVEEEP